MQNNFFSILTTRYNYTKLLPFMSFYYILLLLLLAFTVNNLILFLVHSENKLIITYYINLF